MGRAAMARTATRRTATRRPGRSRSTQGAQECLEITGAPRGAVGSSGGERPSPLILSQQDGGAEGSLTRVVPGRAGAALTKPGRSSTGRWGGSGERDGEEYARN